MLFESIFAIFFSVLLVRTRRAAHVSAWPVNVNTSISTVKALGGVATVRHVVVAHDNTNTVQIRVTGAQVQKLDTALYKYQFIVSTEIAQLVK
jgi:hypothetical protein